MSKRLAISCLLLAATATGQADHEPPRVERDPRYLDEIRRVATGYAKWGRVDERPNIAPSLCRVPLPEDYGAPAHVRLSQADDAPHGRKLYFLYASDRRIYLNAEQALPVGFSIVKESFAAVPTNEAAAPEPDPLFTMTGANPPTITTAVDGDGHRLKLGERKDLFVMVKVGDEPGSDGGWVYGTVAPDGTVTSAGRVASCMSCHDEAAAREKLFGLRPAPKP